MLEKGQISNEIIKRMNSIKDVEQTDIDEAIRNEAESVESYVFEAIKSITITIPPGAIRVTTPQGEGINIEPIILNNIVE